MNTLRKQPKIIIIGAGMAGISAAKRLVDAGFKNVLVLEAADRIGGRIHTVPFGDGNFPVELGSNWIHGPTLQNSTFQIANTIGALQPYRLINRMSSRFMREDGLEINREIIKEAVHIFDKVVNDVYKTIINERLKHNRIITIAPLVFEYLNNELQKVNADDKYKKDMERVWNASLNFWRFHDGDEFDRVTWEKEEEEYNIPGGGHVHIPGGYIQIINHLMKSIPKESVLLHKEVVGITWDSGENIPIDIKIKDGSTYEADHVIVTSSIGYLQKHHEKMFKPKLPRSKIEVLNSLELGRVNKIFLEFDQPIFAPTYKGIAFAWNDTSIGNIENEWYKRIFGFDQIFTKNNTVLGWICGDAAEYMEKLSDDEIGTTCVGLLRKFLGNQNIPRPKSVLVSRWCSNPYVLGSYFHQTKRMIPGEQTILSEPVKASSGGPLIMFAGEALTNGCTHGARDSGIMQAERLIDLYRKNGPKL